MEKLFLPSRIRRGRTATSPVWRATHGGLTLEFHRKRDAMRFEQEGCVGHPRSFMCPCGGHVVYEKPQWQQALEQLQREHVEAFLRENR